MHGDMVGRRSRDRWIYHFTHLDNIAVIFTAGHLACDLMAREGLTRTEVGDPAIKQSRRQRSVLAGPGGQVGDYVPFYFAPRSPMMYRIACEHRDGRPNCYPDGDRPLVYLVTTVGAVIDTGSDWVATDGNAATATSEFTANLRAMEEMVDWPLLTAERWHNTSEDMDRQRRRQAEFLVHQRLPTRAIRWIGVYDGARRAQVSEVLHDHLLARSRISRRNQPSCRCGTVEPMSSAMQPPSSVRETCVARLVQHVGVAIKRPRLPSENDRHNIAGPQFLSDSEHGHGADPR
ncbi:type II toxin-antitoxin system toxin DNA ADP-ribosyl transferase DarT [Plantactinospora sp. WMMC1484]|uniref:type II toxin-antitoxin system toxin DNA ADP-ribosyl transferase DarT n=1 Tax=Plantactinospora sp. WMMC1484 TaxID=3404122 RepID=UPI003BF5E98C